MITYWNSKSMLFSLNIQKGFFLLQKTNGINVVSQLRKLTVQRISISKICNSQFRCRFDITLLSDFSSVYVRTPFQSLSFNNEAGKSLIIIHPRYVGIFRKNLHKACILHFLNVIIEFKKTN